MNLSDSIVTIAPITDVIALDSKNAFGTVIDSNEMNFVCVSGYHLRSYITFAKEGVPYDAKVLNKDIKSIKSVFTIRDQKAPNSFDLYLIIS